MGKYLGPEPGSLYWAIRNGEFPKPVPQNDTGLRPLSQSPEPVTPEAVSEYWSDDDSDYTDPLTPNESDDEYEYEEPSVYSESSESEPEYGSEEYQY